MVCIVLDFSEVRSDGIVISVPASHRITMVQVLKLVQASSFYIGHILLNFELRRSSSISVLLLSTSSSLAN